MSSKPQKFRGRMGSLPVTWYRGKHTNYLPNKKTLEKENAIEQFLLNGWLPDEPFIKHNSHIVAIGSCFAREVSNYLAEQGYSSLKSVKGRHDAHEFIDEGVNNTFALRQLLEWSWTGKEPKDETWHNSKSDIMERNEERRKESAKYFSKSNVIIITLGLSEVWYNKETEDVYWRAVPYDEFDKSKHGYRVSNVEENKKNLQVILDLIEQHAPKAKVIITLSPVPLIATFRPIGCIVANSVSKAILRVAVDEVMRERDVQNNDKLFYWPSYEIVKEYAKSPYKEDNRHITRETVELIMETFSKYYVK